MQRRTAVWLSIVAAVAGGGCSQQRLTYTPEQDSAALEQTEFAHAVAQQPMVTYDQLCRAMLLLADGDEFPGSFEERAAELRSRGIVREEWPIGAKDVVDRGHLAYMIFRVCGMPGGLNTRLAEWTGLGCERYALKEVARARIMRYGLPYQVPTGGEVMRVIARADDYMAEHAMYESVEKEIGSPRDVE